ncbi:MAG: cytochrome o ubiquinol oxidase subunit IV [Alphaproteobacteria bacterium]|nr:cytochrome o ubiquinol oxidase subunit IV [Alphaproteobacteria bacterium]
MSHIIDTRRSESEGDRAPGYGEYLHGRTVAESIVGYLIGLGLAVGLTAGSFFLAQSHLIYGPAIPVALIVFAVAQMGVHLAFFLHITTGPDSTNNVLALAFGVLIVFLLIAGSLWIMANLNHNMMPAQQMHQMMQMQR